MGEGAQFHGGLWGYSKRQVHEYLSELRRDFESKRDELVARQKEALAENKALQERLQKIASDLEKYREQEHLIAKVLIEAQVRAAAIEREAQEKAERLKKEVMDEIARKRTELANLKNRVEQFKRNFSQMLDSCKASLSAFDGLASKGPEEETFVPGPARAATGPVEARVDRDHLVQGRKG